MLRSLLLSLILANYHVLLQVGAQEDTYTYGDDFYYGPYKHIYPPVDIRQDQGSCYPNENTTCPLYVAIMFSFGGSFDSSGVIPGVQLALDQINNDSTILSGYRLHYILKDSQCNRSVSLASIHTHVIQPPTKIGVIGSGCSVATEASAEVTPFYNLTQISCVSSSTALSNQIKFPLHFQISSSEINLAYGFYGIIKAFRWRQIAIFTQDENLFTVTINKVISLFDEFLPNVTVKERRFKTLDTLGNKPFDQDSRIFILSMFDGNARILLCKAHEQGLVYPNILFMLPGWYGNGWWIGTEEEQRELMDNYDGCSVTDRENAAKYTLAPLKAGRTFSDPSLVADSGISGREIDDIYQRYVSASSLNLDYLIFYQQCYDATWLLARTLNATLNEFRSNASITEEFAAYTLNVSGDQFGLNHFTYNNSKFTDIVLGHLKNSDFNGIVGPIRFDDNGVRVVPTVDVYQFRPSSTDGNELMFIKIAELKRGNASDGDTRLAYIDDQSDETTFPSGVPLDGIPREVHVGVLLPLSAIFFILGIIGIGFSVTSIILHFLYRNRVVVRLSSPKLNILVGVGAIILYIDIIVTVMPTTNPILQTVFCNMTPWLTAYGYSLCYGTILVKMARVWYIFNNPSQKKIKAVRDWRLFIGVGFLVAVDFLTLIIYTAVEGSRGNLIVQRIPSVEYPQEIINGEIINYFVFVCQSRSRSITLAVLYGYKMTLQVVALVFSFSIRKVKIKGLNDAVYIAACIYITSIVTAIIIVITYTLDVHVNLFAGIFSACVFIGTTAILALVMIPPLINQIKDPNGENIFSSFKSTVNANSANNPITIAEKSRLSSVLPSENNQSVLLIEELQRKNAELELKLKLQDDLTQKGNEAMKKAPKEDNNIVPFPEESSNSRN